MKLSQFVLITSLLWSQDDVYVFGVQRTSLLVLLCWFWSSRPEWVSFLLTGLIIGFSHINKL